MLKDLDKCKFGNYYRKTVEYKELRRYLENDATMEELKSIIPNMPNVQIAFGGKNKGYETIQENYLLWKKGTRAFDIEKTITDIIICRNK